MATKQAPSAQEQMSLIRIFCGLFLCGFTFLLAFAFVSYLFTWRNDQSMLDIPLSALFSDKDILVQNWSGKVGALLAHCCMYKGIGVAAFGLVIILFCAVFNIFLKENRLPLLTIIEYVSGYAIWTSIAMGYFFQSSQFAPGGMQGHFVSEWLNATIGRASTFMLLLIFLFILMSLTIKGFVDKCRSLIDRVRSLRNVKMVEVEPIAIGPTDQPEVENTTDVETEKSEVDDAELVDDNLDSQNDEQPNVNEVDLSISISEKAEESSTDSDFEITHAVITDDGDSDNNYEDNLEVVETSPAEELPKQDEVEPKEQQTESTKTDIEIDHGVEEEEAKTISDKPLEDYDPKLELSHYTLPSIDLLKEYETNNDSVSEELVKENKDKIVQSLADFKIEIESIKATIGPAITLYEIVPKRGTKIAKIKSLADDLALSLSALQIRIIAPIPGKNTVGIEVPNAKASMVSMRSMIKTAKFQESKMELPVAIGRTITNEVFMFDLAKTPHLLVAGATGQGKSVGLNAIVTSLLYKKHPSQLKFVMVDPKMVEFSIYKDLEKHYMAKYPDDNPIIITDCDKVKQTLNSLVQEMEDRYKLLMEAKCRNIVEYNNRFIKRQLNPNNGHKYLCYIVIIIDEFGDFIMQAGKEIETPIARIAQKARAVGMHMILATQRPSVNIITGIIKANVPGRMAFRTSSSIDSRTILDANGAERLVGKGDLLISPNGQEPERVQCAFVDTDEVVAIVNHIKSQQSYLEPYMLPELPDETGGEAATFDTSKKDILFEEVARFVVSTQTGSTSNIQRKFEIGYNRAGRIMDQLEGAGIVGPQEGSKPRRVQIQDEFSLDQLLAAISR
ncbi:MAG: DNA translocase FtsK [Salinivirgaceae bacterium]|nr:DNA translocase FtsK [Salinivirgaceae bacterium]